MIYVIPKKIDLGIMLYQKLVKLIGLELSSKQIRSDKSNVGEV